MKFFIISIFIFTISISCSANDLITPIPSIQSYDKNKVLLGKKLFYEVKLSHSNAISCATCHYLNDGGDDNKVGAMGNNGKVIPRNSPTVYNAIFNETQHWDGTIKDLYDQADNSITHPLAMNSNYKEIIAKLQKDTNYKRLFKKAYRASISKENILDAIVQFEKLLTTPNSRFDKYLRGEDVLNENEKEGYQLFQDYGCISCHNGVNIGGNLIQKIGILKTYKTKDLGRFLHSNLEEDMYYFKVPSLRNIELTAPYFHDGKIKTLKKAVETMIEYQIGYSLTNKQIDNIIEFLKTLNGETPKILKDKDYE